MPVRWAFLTSAPDCLASTGTADEQALGQAVWCSQLSADRCADCQGEKVQVCSMCIRQCSRAMQGVFECDRGASVIPAHVEENGWGVSVNDLRVEAKCHCSRSSRPTDSRWPSVTQNTI
jgi:hypothetical protein